VADAAADAAADAVADAVADAAVGAVVVVTLHRSHIAAVRDFKVRSGR